MLHHGRQVNPLAIWQVLVAALDTKLTAGGPPIVTLGTVHRPGLLEAVCVWGGGGGGGGGGGVSGRREWHSEKIRAVTLKVSYVEVTLVRIALGQRRYKCA